MVLRIETNNNFETSESQLEQSKEFGRAYETSRLQSDLDSSISCAENALHAAEAHVKQRGDCLINLSYRLQQRYESAHNVADLEKAISLLKQYQDDPPKEDEMIPFSYMLLSDYYAMLFEHDHSRESLETAIMVARLATAMPDLNPYQRKIAGGTLDRRLDTLYDLDGGLRLLDERIKLKARLSEDETLKEDQMMHYADAMSRCLREKYEITKDFQCLDQSVKITRKILNDASPDFSERYQLLSHLSTAIAKKAEADPKSYSNAIPESIDLLFQGLKICPDDDIKRRGLLMNLMNRYCELYSSKGDLQDLERGIMNGREAVGLTSENDDSRPMLLQDLAICLKRRHEAMGDIRDLDEAIDLYRSAIALEKQPRDKSMVCQNLSLALRQRYHISAALKDLEEAVTQGQRAIELIPEGHVAPIEALDSLGSAFSDIYRRLNRPEDLENAIYWSRKAVSLVPEESADRGMYTNNLGSKMWAKYKASHSLADRDEALRLAREAVRITSAGDTERPKYVGNLGDILYNIWDEAGPEAKRKEDIDEAISLVREAIALTPKNHVHWSDYTTSLGWRLTKVMEEFEELDEAIKIFKSAFDSQSGSIPTRIEAGRVAGLFLMFRDKWEEAYSLYLVILDLLSRASPRSVSRDDMQARLSGLSNISTFACGACIKTGGTPGQALAVLERGRGIISGLYMNLRSDNLALLESYPDLHAEYQSVQSALFLPEKAQSEGSAPSDMVLERRKLEHRLEKIEKEIRQKPGFDMFQLAPSADQLLDLARSGPLVCFNVTRWRCDAFVVTAAKVELIPLPDLTEQEVQVNVRKIVGQDRLTNCSVMKRASNNKVLRKIFKWLWQVAVKHVFEYLKFEAATGDPDNLPRIWWITSGPMGLMPHHAAGSQWGKSDQNTASRAISSYSPTFRALAYARQRAKAAARATDPPPPSILAVPMPTTPSPGWLPLNTDAELSAINDSTSTTSTPITIISQPTPTSVLSSLPSYPFIHFSCHGDPNFTDPSLTSLLLHSENDPDTVARLSVSSLADLSLPHAQLAYLSACCTAQQYRMDLIDENIHLGSAFQLMGFPAVIATLWEADDKAAAVVSGEFYREFLNGMKEGEGREVGDVAARSLHMATKVVREKQVGRGDPSDDVIGWGSFAHIGA